jgi:hypothetical protein
VVETKVKEGLGIDNETRVEAQLYKLLIYPPGWFVDWLLFYTTSTLRREFNWLLVTYIGGHFQYHRDSEKAKGMVSPFFIDFIQLSSTSLSFIHSSLI